MVHPWLVCAGFHNATLYEALRPSIGPLVALLRDEEDKTRANAAGALGNLVRNSSQLCGELIKVGGAAYHILSQYVLPLVSVMDDLECLVYVPLS